MIVLNTQNKDDDFNGERKFDLSTNDDGTISLADRTSYTQKGDEFGAKEVNEMNAAIMGFTTSNVQFNDDGSILETDVNGYTKKTTFSKDDDGNDVITETLQDDSAAVIGTKTTTIYAGGKSIKEEASV